MDSTDLMITIIFIYYEKNQITESSPNYPV
jgi:hypothetical protein